MPVGAVIYGASLVAGAIGSSRARRAARRQALREQAAANIQAGQVRAAGQMAGFEERRQADLVHSRALALAAASGAGASDVTATKILSDIDAEGHYRSAVRMYEAENEARMIELEGRTRASALNDQARAYGITGAADLLTGVGSMFSRYGGGGPDKTPDTPSGTDTGGYLDH